MPNQRVRATALTYTDSGNPLAPGEEASLPDHEAKRLIETGKAVAVQAKPKKTQIKKEESDAAPGK